MIKNNLFFYLILVIVINVIKIVFLGLPRFDLHHIETWPAAEVRVQLERESAANCEPFDDFENDDSKEDFLFVDINQLKLLTRHCYVCGCRVGNETQRFSTRGGIIFLKFWCSSCSKHRYWKSYERSVSSIMAGSSVLAGIGFAKILNFFCFLRCAFPSRRAIFSAAKDFVYPVIRTFYNNDRLQILNSFITSGQSINICMDGQFDSPGFCAYYCTVSALEASTNKLIGFATVKRSEVNNCSTNAEPLAVRRLMDDLLNRNISIASVTTDGSKALGKVFRENYPNIRHYLDLYHILRAMYRKFAPKFNRVGYLFLFLRFL